MPVWFTAGERRTERWEDGGRRVSLGKAFMVSRLQALLGSGRLHLPRTAETGALTRELLNYEIRVDGDGNERTGAFKVGTHDDLVTALGLAVQVDPFDPVAMFGGAKRHAMRRSYVSRLLEARVDPLTVQELAGHAAAVTTARGGSEAPGDESPPAALARLKPRSPS